MGHGNVIHFIIKYDVKEIIPLLMTLLDQLNHNVEVVVAPCDELVLQIEEEDSNMFGVGTSMKESS